jgi:hypothetical protein
MKPIDVLVDPPRYPVRLMIRDTLVFLTPIILSLFVSYLWGE